MEKSFQVLEFDKVLEILSGFASSELGKQRCLVAQVYDDFSKISKELTYTSEARFLLNQFIEPPLDYILDIKDAVSDAKKGLTLSAQELVDISKVLKTSRLTKRYLERNSNEAATLAEFFDLLVDNKELEDKIYDTFDAELNIKDSASTVLKALRNSLRDSEQNLKNEISRLLNSPSFVDNLQDTVWTTRDERVVFQVRAECKNKLGGIVHDTSASGQTFFVEPKQLVPLNNKIREVKVSILAEIQRILSELSLCVSQIAGDILTNLDNLVELDFIFARARYSLKNDFACPEILEEKKIDLKGLKNPVLMSVTNEVVENNFYLDKEKNCLIITGSNTGGKTVLIKTIGLMILMTKAGMHVPCYEAKVYPFKDIFADIGDEQSIVQSLSTFSSHMKNIISIINNSNDKSLIILDEIAAGTDPQEGASIAQAVLENLQQKGSFVLCTTHYGELKSLAYLKDGFKNASVEFNTQTLSPTYKLLMDIPGASNAINISQNLGLPVEIVEKARQIHYTQKDKTAEVLQELQQTQQVLSQSAKEAQRLEKSAGDLKQEYSEKVEEIKKQKKKNIDVYKKKYETRIHNARKEIKDILDELRAEKSEKVARRAYARLAQLEHKARQQFSDELDEVSQKYQKIDWDIVKVGEKVIVKGLDQKAEIISLPDKNNNVQIQMGLIKTKVKTDKLAKYDSNIAKKPIKNTSSFVSSKKFVYNKYDLSQTLDLRGYRVEEALDELEAYLDKASLANLTPVYIIHGHGTGALKSVLRDYISTSPYVCKYRVGEQAEGGDGVTVIDIN